ncbi:MULTISPECIES: ABC transporter ATP-binding protein [Marinobacter]|jgi:iron complex transport system ATP-binding protein|uniref:ABC transporter ATP-binding protein n=1 Tax=Marinobacter TaxID=2742 RepID=UPI0007D91B9F|nr:MULTISPECIES: ABC transporter ATP-binding protein [unclassified Marinobacter]MBL3823538.1 ABC transporter ATP-binding protein [Marinobacter sp. MC3]MBL3891694.1 ABC transporter ATP-binding protein [Marinobacter sp. MW3]OAN88451.1 ABC transporter [Marinobacter sp. EhN04]OAN91433.1 ABC transporter [Marinobacter sp. EhC06]
MTDQTQHSLTCNTDHGPLKGERLSVGYGETVILDDVDFHLEPGKLTVLLGPNGCGKSTLLKTLARTLSPRTGRVLLDGQDIHRQPTRAVARRLGVLPQSPNAPDGLSVRELVGLGRFPYQTLVRQWSRRDESAVTRAMEAADVSQFADRPVDSLSGGQRQRCWIAMVLAQETQWLLLDEPTTFLDLKVQVDLMELLESLCHQHGRTLLVVLHDLNLAAAYADELVLMRAGRIRYRGAPVDVFNEPALADVFGLRAQVLVDPANGRPFCVPVKGQGQQASGYAGRPTGATLTL